MQFHANYAALLTSISGQITTGVLPPNSSPTFFKFDLAEDSKIFFPTAVEPVNEIFETCLELAKYYPAVLP